jgi:NADH:ubiquinone oxidoreductase subunit 6 (subunit J)
VTGDQVPFAIAGAVAMIGAVVAATHRDPRAAGAALLATLLALAVLYASLAAPLVAGVVVVLALFATVPVAVHANVRAVPAEARAREAPVAGAAIVVCAALLLLIGFAVAFGEVPVNVSLRSADGYDLAALAGTLAAHALPAAAAGGLAIVAALFGLHAIRRAPR